MAEQSKEAGRRGIYSEVEEDIVYSELRLKDPVYGLIFKTIVETGINFKRLTELKVSEIVGRDTLRYTSRLGYEREMPMSRELQQALSAYAAEANKSGEDIYFTGTRGNNPVHPATLSQVLKAVSDKCGIEPYLTTTSLHMTFAYRLIQADGNCQRAKQYLHASTDKAVYEYLGLPLPNSVLKKRRPSSDCLEISPDLVFRIADSVNAAMFKAMRALNKGSLGKKASQSLLRYLSAVDQANAEFSGTVGILN